MERLVRQFGDVWVASQDGMAAIGTTQKDALDGLADCVQCKTLAPFRLPNGSSVGFDTGRGECRRLFLRTFPL
jgi:hypothetical protein